MGRNTDEADAIYVGMIQPGEACCANCGWACPPWNPDLDKRYINCAFPHYEDFPLKKVSYFSKCWIDAASVGVVPEWCEPYTKIRKAAAHSPKMPSGFDSPSTTRLLDSEPNLSISESEDNVKPTISDVVRLQEERIQFAWNGLEVLERTTTNRNQEEVAKDLKAQLKIMDAEIAHMRKSL